MVVIYFSFVFTLFYAHNKHVGRECSRWKKTQIQLIKNKNQLYTKLVVVGFFRRRRRRRYTWAVIYLLQIFIGVYRTRTTMMRFHLGARLLVQ